MTYTALANHPQEPVLADQLEPIARKIELLETTAILQIAAEAAKIHETFRYCRGEGGYTGYMKRRLGYSSSNAYRLLDVHARFGRNVSQIWERLPVSTVYLLAAPATPEEALNEVAKRIEAGEKPTCAMVTEVIATAKSKDGDAAPSPDALNPNDDNDVLAGEPTIKEMVIQAVTGRRKSPAPAEPDPADPADPVESDAAASAEARGISGLAASEVADHEHGLDGADGVADHEHDPDGADDVDGVAVAVHGEDDQPECDAPVIDAPMNGNTASDPPSKLSAEVWCAATSPADETVKIEIMQGEELESILARMSETQKDKLFDRLVALQIRQAKLASKSADDMLKSLTGTFWYAAGQDDPQKIAEAVTVINGKLKMRGLSAKDIKFTVVNRERTISPTVAAAAQAARENLKRKKR